MDQKQILLQLFKDKIGMRTDKRDEYFNRLIQASVDEMIKQNDIIIDYDNISHLNFISDYAVWKYKRSPDNGGMPRFLQFDLHNLFIRDGKSNV